MDPVAREGTRMARGLGLLRPQLWVGSVSEIEIEPLAARGIRGLILDLDETLVAAVEHTPSPEVRAWIDRVKGHFKVFILSNNFNPARVQRVADALGVPCSCRAAKPRRRGFRLALAQMELAAHEVAIVGDQLFTDVLVGNRMGALTILATPIQPERKPWRKLMRLAEGMVIRDVDTLRQLVPHAKENP
jgi:hypothetical protein